MDFRITGKDNGYNESSAVQPVLNGEDANQTTFQRPSENLRTRTEVVRKTVDNILAEMQADRGLCVGSLADTRIRFNYDTGKFRINSTGTDVTSDRDLVIVPITGTSTAASGGSSAIPAKYYYTDSEVNQGKFQAVAKSTIFAYNGGNNLWMKIFKNARTLASPVVTIEGAGGGGSYPADGPVTICVEIDKDDLNTIDQVVAALQAAPALTYLDPVLTQTIGAYGTNAVEERTQQIFSQDPGGMAAVDNECYRVTAAELHAFFYTTGKTLAAGDSLVLNFGTAATRRACTFDTPVGTLLQIVSEDSRNMAGGHVVPICKRVSGDLLFFHGKRITGCSSAMTTFVGDYFALGPSQNLDALIADLAAQTGTPKGDFMIGSEARSGTPYTLPAGTLASQVAALVGNLNIHITAPASPAAYHSSKFIKNKPFVVVDKGGTGDYTTITAALKALSQSERGGTIYVKADDGTPYLENITNVTDSFNVRGPIDIVGLNTTTYDSTPGPYVEIDSATATLPVFTISNASPPLADTRLRFYNILFKQTGNSVALSIANCDVELHNCSVYRTVAASYSNSLVKITTGRVFRGDKSTFASAFATDSSPVVAAFSSTLERVEFRDCTFDGVAKILAAGPNTLIFEGNNIMGCGYAASGDPGYLFQCTGMRNYSVQNNFFNADCASVVGMFGATGSGAFCNNNIEIELPTFGTQTLVNYMLNIIGWGGTGTHVVQGNYIKCGAVSGLCIYSGSGGEGFVLNNSIETLAPDYTEGYGINAGSCFGACTIEGNRVAQSGGTVTSGINYGSGVRSIAGNSVVVTSGNGIGEGATCDTMSISGNWVNVTSPAAGSVGIYAGAGSFVRVTANSIYLGSGSPSASGTGIKYGVLVTGNYIEGGALGIQTRSQRGAVTGNFIKVGGPTSTGIKGSEMAYMGVISGNSILDAKVGIDMSLTYIFVCSNNYIFLYPTTNAIGISAAQSSSRKMWSSITGNSIQLVDVDSDITGTVGIDLTYVDDCAVSGNNIGEGSNIATPIKRTSMGNSVGLGKDLAAENLDTHNLFRTTAP